MNLGLVKLAHRREQASDSMTSVWVSAHLYLHSRRSPTKLQWPFLAERGLASAQG